MRRNVAVFMSTLTVLVLLFSYRTSLHRAAEASVASAAVSSDSTGTTDDSADASTDDSSTDGKTTKAASKTFTGKTVKTQWGPVEVRITVKDKKITASKALVYPTGTPTHEQINGKALPVLAKEAVAAQSSKIDTVSGATETSEGYSSSLQSAIDAANL